MAFEFKLPDIGEGVTEGEVVKWLVKAGDQVKDDQPIVEIMTDKATVEIASPKSGTIDKILVTDGQMVKVGSGLVMINDGGESLESKPEPNQQDTPQQKQTSQQPSGTSAQAKTQDTGKTGEPDAQTIQAAGGKVAPQPSQQQGAQPTQKPQGQPQQQTQSQPQPQAQTSATRDSNASVLASPATRKYAREQGIDLASVQGSGDSGRVTREDIEKSMGAPSAASNSQQPPTMQAATSAGAPKAAPDPSLSIPKSAVATGKEEERIPVRGIRKKIIEHMRRSVDHAAHFTHMDEFDATNLVDIRNSLKDDAAKYGVKLNYLPFVVKATTLALQKHPRVNVSLDEEKNEIIVKHYCNIGVAVATKDNDLIVPVIQNADKKSLLEIAAEIKSLAEKAQTNKLTPTDLQGGTFTITSLGPLAGTYATPIINYPEAGILGFFAIKERPVVVDGEITIRHMGNIAVSLDHRIVDGYLGAQFAKTLIEYLENPATMLLFSA